MLLPSVKQRVAFEQSVLAMLYHLHGCRYSPVRAAGSDAPAQLVGLLLCVFVRDEVAHAVQATARRRPGPRRGPHRTRGLAPARSRRPREISLDRAVAALWPSQEIHTEVVKTGFAGLSGNKGAVALRFSLLGQARPAK